MKRLPFLACLVLLLLLVPAALATVIVSSISPSSWPNNGVATVTISGNNFNTVKSISLSGCGRGISYGTITYAGPSSITGTFDVSGYTPGKYNVRVQTQVTDSIFGTHDDWGYLNSAFNVYQASGSTTTTTTTTTTGTTVPETTITSGQGENSVFFESTPGGAEIWLEGEDIGTTAFTYYTNREGTYDVVVKKIGYEDYTAKVTVIEGKRVHFSAVLTPLLETSVNATKTTPTTATSRPSANVTTNQKSTLKIPTPLGPDPAYTEESPADPAIALLAAVSGLGFLVIRRR